MVLEIDSIVMKILEK